MPKKPLIVYVTSIRENAQGQIAQDVIPELLNQLQKLPKDANDLDFLVVSNGGDGTVAWRIVSLIRERVKKFSILIPQGAFSAATLIALGANEIVMHPHGNLGPTDPQITNQKKGIQFGSEDVQAFLRFAKENVGLKDGKNLSSSFLRFCEEVGFVAVGVAARSSQLSVSMGENMLRLHLDEAKGKQSPRAISQALNTQYFHHGYPLNRTEAKTIGLPVAAPVEELENLMWAIWKDIETDLHLREAFVPMELVRADPNCQQLFSPIPQMHIPPGANQMVLQLLAQQFFAQHGNVAVSPTPYEITIALMESPRTASRARVEGKIFAARQFDLEVKINLVPERVGWIDVALPLPAPERVEGEAGPQPGAGPGQIPPPQPGP